MSEEGVSVGKDPPAGVVVECGKQQVPSHSSGRTTTPRDFAAQVTSTCTLLALCGDDAGAMAVVAALRDGPAQNAGAAPRALVTFGIGDANDWRACNVTRGSGTVAFDITLRRGGRVPGARITLPADPTLSAEHQVSATLGALLAACLLDAGAAHAAEGGHMDLVAAAVDIPELLASAKAAAALTGEP